MEKSPGKMGRPEGSHNRMSREAREAARSTGRLPHEILLDIARGNPQKLRVLKEGTQDEYEDRVVGVSLEDVKDAAKAAAPYYAPKISTVEVISGVSDDDLDAIIRRAASEAGVSIGPCGEGQEAQGTPGRRRADL